MVALVFLALIAQPPTAGTRSYRIQGDLWSLSVLEDRNQFEPYVSIKKGGVTVLERTAEEMHGSILQVVRAYYPTPWPVFVVSCYTGVGHGLQTEFYAIKGGRLELALTVPYERGGPIFRDFDSDGVMEWVFDDYHYYTHYGRGPEHYLVYKLSEKGTIEYWMSLSNPKREHVPMPWYRCF